MRFTDALRRLRASPAADGVPELKGAPLVGHAAAFRSDPFALMGRAASEGSMVRISLPGAPVWLVTDPRFVGAMLDDQGDWVRGEGLAPLLGRNMLTSNGAAWSTARTMAQPSFHPRMTDVAAGIFARHAGPLLDALPSPDDGPTDLALRLGQVFAEAAPPAFGLDVRPHEAARFPGALDVLQTWAFRSLAGGARRSSAVRDAQALLDGILARSLAHAPAPGPPTLLERLRQDHSIPRDDLAGHLRLLLIASADNPPNTTASVLWLLAHHPAPTAALVAQVDRTLGPRPPTPEDLAALPLLQAIIDESLRLLPPVWWLARHATRDTALGPHALPAGTLAFLGTYWLHRDPTRWAEPERFDPARFAPGAPPPPDGSYLPFGRGPRRCVGTRFARQTIALAVVMVLQRFQLRPAHPRPLPWFGRFALRSRCGVPVHLERRTSR